MIIKKDFSDFEWLEKQLNFLKNNQVVAGIPGEGWLYVKPVYNNGVATVDYGYWLDQGTSKMVARPFFRRATEFNKKEINSYFVKLIKRLQNKAITGQGVYEKIGEFVVKAIKFQIESGSFTALRPSTIAKKGNSKTLIDTGSLLRSVAYEIRSV